MRIARVRALLVEQIGVEPGAELRLLHEAILRQDCSLDAHVPGEDEAANVQSGTMAGDFHGLLDRQTSGFVGRASERAELLRLLDPQGPIVSFVWGQPGVGKSALLRTFCSDAAARGAAVVELDGSAMEPTDVGFLAALSRAVGTELASPSAARDAIGALGRRVVVAIDAYERLRPLDDWLRATWLPDLPDHVRVAIAGREAPVAEWSAQYGALAARFGLDSLPPEDALELLRRLGVPAERALRFNRVLRGQPLSLRLVGSRPSGVRGMDDPALHAALEELTGLYLADLDQDMRPVLDAASVVRRVTVPLLAAMLPESSATDAYDRLRRLPFVWAESDGLIVFHVIRSALAAQLRSADPATYRRLRAVAWHQLRSELGRAPPGQLWRYGADMLYLSDRPRYPRRVLPEYRAVLRP